MPRPYYAEYVYHMLRYYAKTVSQNDFKKIQFRSDVDKKNWLSIERVLARLSERDKDIVIVVFNKTDTLADNVYQIAKEMCIPQDDIWSLISTVVNKVAKDRKLI